MGNCCSARSSEPEIAQSNDLLYPPQRPVQTTQPRPNNLYPPQVSVPTTQPRPNNLYPPQRPVPTTQPRPNNIYPPQGSVPTTQPRPNNLYPPQGPVPTTQPRPNNLYPSQGPVPTTQPRPNNLYPPERSVPTIQPGRQVDFKEQPVIIPANTVRKLLQYSTHSGGLADVWQCFWRQTSGTGEVKVAVKSIRVLSAEDETSIQQTQRNIRREAYVWMKLEHENILKFYGIVEDFGVLPALVSPWMENGSLDGYLKRHRDILPRDIVLNMLKQIAAGLQYLHDNGIVHGDLTCTNVLMGDDRRLCLADFGLSMIIAESQNPTFHSCYGGNMRWLAPESFTAPTSEHEGRMTKPTKAADVYSYGCIMLQLLSGKQPYHWLSHSMAVSGEIYKGKEPFREHEIVNVNEKYKRYSLRCLSRDFRRRPDVSEIVEFLRTAQ